MKKNLFSLLFVFFILKSSSATYLYNQGGIKLNHILFKEKAVYIPSLSSNVIIWKSTFELLNESKKAIAVRIPCYLFYVYAYLNPAEISTVQSFVPEYSLSDDYKNFVAEKPQMLYAKHSLISQKYFVTMDNVDLQNATMNLNFKFSFWE